MTSRFQNLTMAGAVGELRRSEASNAASQIFHVGRLAGFPKSSRVTTSGVELMKQEFGCLYLMRNERNGMIKIGYSTNPKYREATLQSQEPEVNLIFYCEGTVADEQSTHEYFAKNRIRGEWFKLTEKEIKSAESFLMGCGALPDREMYQWLCNNKWHHWIEVRGNWYPIKDWKTYVVAFDRTLKRLAGLNPNIIKSFP